MKEIKKDLLERLLDLPTSLVGLIILLVALFLVYKQIITFQDFMAFAVMALPFFYLKKQKEDSKEDENKE